MHREIETFVYNRLLNLIYFIVKWNAMETCYFGYWWGAEERRHAAVSESDRRLIFRSGKPQCLVSQPSLLHSHATWKEVRSSIRRGALYLCAPPSLFIFFLLTHSTSFVLSPLNTPPLDSVRSLSHIFVISLRLSLACFSMFLSSAFFLFPSQALFCPWVLVPPPPHHALAPWYSFYSSAAASELSWAHVPPEKP